MKNLYVFCFVILLSIVLFFICGYIDIYTVKSKKKGPKILLIGGTHGNEPSGYVTLLRLQNAFKTTQNTQILVGSAPSLPSSHKIVKKRSTKI